MEFLLRRVDGAPHLPVAFLTLEIEFLQDNVFRACPLDEVPGFLAVVDSDGLDGSDTDNAFAEVGLFAEGDGEHAVGDHAGGRVRQERAERPPLQPARVLDPLVGQ